MDSRPAATTTPPPPSAASTRPASERHPCSGSRIQAMAADTIRMNAPTRKNWGWESPPPPSSRPAPIVPRRLRRAKRRGGRDEGERVGEVREVAARQVHPEHAGEQPRQQPRGPSSVRAPTHQRDRGGPDRCPQRVLQSCQRRDEPHVQGAGHRRDQRRGTGPGSHQGDAFGRAHAGPPEVHGFVGPDAERPAIGERGPQEEPEQDRDQREEPQEISTLVAGRGVRALPRRAEGALGVHRDRPVLALDVRAQERAAHLVGEGRGDRDQTFTRARLEEDEAVRPLDRELQESFSARWVAER